VESSYAGPEPSQFENTNSQIVPHTSNYVEGPSSMSSADGSVKKNAADVRREKIAEHRERRANAKALSMMVDATGGQLARSGSVLTGNTEASANHHSQTSSSFSNNSYAGHGSSSQFENNDAHQAPSQFNYTEAVSANYAQASANYVKSSYAGPGPSQFGNTNSQIVPHKSNYVEGLSSMSSASGSVKKNAADARREKIAEHREKRANAKAMSLIEGAVRGSGKGQPAPSVVQYSQSCNTNYSNYSLETGRAPAQSQNNGLSSDGMRKERFATSSRQQVNSNNGSASSAEEGAIRKKGLDSRREKIASVKALSIMEEAVEISEKNQKTTTTRQKKKVSADEYDLLADCKCNLDIEREVFAQKKALNLLESQRAFPLVV